MKKESEYLRGKRLGSHYASESLRELEKTLAVLRVQLYHGAQDPYIKGFVEGFEAEIVGLKYKNEQIKQWLDDLHSNRQSQDFER